VSDATYLERRPAADLRADVACVWTGRIGDTGARYIDQILPDGCLDIIWDGSRLFVAGPDTGPVPLTARPGATFVGIRFRPGHAPPTLGCPASALRDQRTDLEDLWSAGQAATIAERLADAGPHTAPAILQSVVRERMAGALPADRLIDGLVATLTGSAPHGPGLISTVAARLGVTERSLHRRCSAAIGYGPKTLDRVLRFRRALNLGHAGGAPNLGALAVAAGYADQAHFTRECRRLGGQTPSELFKTAG
jgi:AraC-like DNA-binding protein